MSFLYCPIYKCMLNDEMKDRIMIHIDHNRTSWINFDLKVSKDDLEISELKFEEIEFQAIIWESIAKLSVDLWKDFDHYGQFMFESKFDNQPYRDMLIKLGCVLNNGIWKCITKPSRDIVAVCVFMFCLYRLMADAVLSNSFSTSNICNQYCVMEEGEERGHDDSQLVDDEINLNRENNEISIDNLIIITNGSHGRSNMEYSYSPLLSLRASPIDNLMIIKNGSHDRENVEYSYSPLHSLRASPVDNEMSTSVNLGNETCRVIVDTSEDVNRSASITDATLELIGLQTLLQIQSYGYSRIHIPRASIETRKKKFIYHEGNLVSRES